MKAATPAARQMLAQLKEEDSENFWVWTAGTFLVSCRAGAREPGDGFGKRSSNSYQRASRRAVTTITPGDRTHGRPSTRVRLADGF